MTIYLSGDYARVAEFNGALFYASVDEWELDADEIENAVAVADMDEDEFACYEYRDGSYTLINKTRV